MEIVNMLVLSTAHVSQSTASRMTVAAGMGNEKGNVQNTEGNGVGVIIYSKGNHGWLVPIIAEDLKPDERFNHESETPEDLAAVLRYAMEKGCTWVMFDKDAEDVEYLPTFEW